MSDSPTENDFDFYLKFAKPLVLNLSRPDDRVLAAAWIQKLRDESIGDLRLRTDYLKLLLFVLQRKRLIGTFAEHPNEVTKLTEFPESNLLDVAKELLETEDEYLKEKILNGLATGAGDFPPFSTEHSADLLEYSAAQDIPNFGVHAYYAISNEPLPNWERTEKAVFPKGTTSATDKGGSSKISTSTSEPGFKPSPSRSGGKSRPRSRSRPSSPKGGPSPSLGSKPKPDEDRAPPTWGSNLIGVSEPPVRDFLAELSSDFPEGGDKYGLQNSSYSSRSAAGTPQKNQVNESPMTPPTSQYSPMLPGGEASAFFLETPPSFLKAESPPQLPYGTRISDVQKSPPRKPLSPISEYQYSPELPTGDADPFFLESPPSFLRAESPPPIPSSTRISDPRQQSPSRKPLSPIAEYQYSPRLPTGDVDPFFLESPPSFLRAESPPPIPCSTRISDPRQSPSRKPLSPIAEYQYSPRLPTGDVDPFFLESPPSFFGAESPPQLPCSTRISSPTTAVPENVPSRPHSRVGERNYDLTELEELGLNQSDLGSDVFDLDNMEDFKIADESDVSAQASVSRRTIDDDLDAFDQMIAEFEKDGTCPLPPCQAKQEPAQQQPSLEKKQPKKTVQKKPIQKKPIQKKPGVSKQMVAKTESAKSISQPRPGSAATQRRNLKPQTIKTTATRVQSKQSISEIKRPRPGSSGISARQGPQLRPPRSFQPVASTSRHTSEIVDSTRKGPQAARSAIPQPGSSRLPAPGSSRLLVLGSRIPEPGSSRLPVPGSRIPEPGSSRLPVPGSRIPEPGSSRLPVPGSRVPEPGSSRLPVPGSRIPEPGSSRLPVPGSRIPAPGSIRIPSHSGSRIPHPGDYRIGAQQSRIPKQGESRIPCPGAANAEVAATRNAAVDSPFLPRGEADPFFLETPPSFLEQASLSSVSSAEYPTIFGVTPFPKKSPQRSFADQTNMTDSFPSPYRGTPPMRSPCGVCASPSSRQEETTDSLPSAYRGTPPPRRSPISSPEYDVDLLKELGLEPDDLKADIFDLDDFNQVDISRLTTSSGIEYEEPPEFNLQDRTIDEELDAWDRQIAELEAEHAEDIALYGSPAKELPASPREAQRAQEESGLLNVDVVPIIPEESQAAQDIIEEANKQFTRSFQHSIPSPTKRPDKSLDSRAQDVTDVAESAHMQYEQPTSPALSLKSFEDLEREIAEDSFLGDIPAYQSPLRTPPGLATPQVAEQMAQRQLEQLRRESALEEEYERYKQLLKRRRPDVPRTPPIFSKFRSLMGDEANRVYHPAEFGETNATDWESGEKFFEGKIRLSPRVGERGSEIKRLNRGTDRQIENKFVEHESMPELESLEDEFENTSIRERSPVTAKTDIKKHLHQVKSDLFQRKESTPADAGLPLTTPRRSPSPKRRTASIRIEGDNEMMTFDIPPYASPEINLLDESPPFAFESPRSPQKTSTRSPGSPIESPSSLRMRLLQGAAPPYYRQNEMLVYSGKPKIIKRRSAPPGLHQIHESPEIDARRPEMSPRRRKVPVELEDTTGFRRAREELERKFADLPQMTQIAPDDLFGVEGYMAPSTSPYSALDSSISEENLPSPVRLPAQVPGWSTPPHLKTQKIKRSRQVTMPELMPELSYHVPIMPRRRDILSQEIPPSELMYSPPTISPGSAPQLKESTPADARLHLTTPRRPPSPKRRAGVLRFDGDEETPTFEIPPYVSPEINLLDESPPTRFDEFEEYENTSIRERSPAAKRTDIKRRLEQVKSDLFQIKESTPADAGLPLTTPRRTPSPKRRTASIRIEADNEMMAFDIPPYASPEINLLDESPPFEFESPRTPQKASARSPGSPIESPSSLRMRLLQGAAPPYYRRNQMLVYSGKPKIIKRRSGPPRLHQIHESPEIDTRSEISPRRKVPVEPEDTTGFRRVREELERKFSDLPQVTQIAPDDLFGVEGYMTPSTSPYSVLDSSISEENLPSPVRPPAQVPGWSTPPHLKTQKIKRSRQVTMPELIPELSHHVPIMPRRRDILFQEIPPSELMYSPPMISPESAPQLKRTTPSPLRADSSKPRSRSPRSQITTPNIFSVIPDDNLGEPLMDEEFPENLYYSPERPQYGSPDMHQYRVPGRRDLFHTLLDSSLFDEAVPEDLYYSPGSPARPQHRQRSPESPISSPESPFNLRLRLWQADEPPYYSQDVTHVVSGRSKAIKRHSAPPKVYGIRELPDDYNEEHIPFMSQIDAASKKWPKRSRRKIVRAPKVSPIKESPIRIPHVTEVDDPTGFRRIREQLEEKYADLPEIPYNVPEDLFGVEGYAAPCPGPYGELDHDIPEGLPSPMRPPTVVPGWSTPPNLRRQRIERPRSEAGLDLPPEWTREVRMQPGVRNILSQEIPPTEMMYSPPPLSPRSSPQIRKSPEMQDVPPRTPSKFPERPLDRDLFSTALDSSLLDEALPENLYYSPERPQYGSPDMQQYRVPGRRDLFHTVLDSSLLDEAVPEDLYYSPGSPARPQYSSRSPESPISSPESPFHLRLRLWNADEPPYYSQDVTHVVSGRSKAIKRHSAPPKVYGIRELPDDYNEEHMPFMSQVDAATKKWPKRSRRRKIGAAPKVSPIRESPVRVPNVTEVDDPTGFRPVREQLERQFAWLPEIPYVAPDDLFGVEGYTQPCPRPYSELDHNIPEGLPSPLRPPTVVPGWSTPPHLKLHKIERPRLVHIPEFLPNREDIRLKHYVQDEISHEAPPIGIAYSPPPFSPRSTPEFRPQTPDHRRSPRSIYQHSRSTQSPTTPELFSVAPDENLLDSLEPEYLYYSPELLPPAESPISSPESPTQLRLRLQQQGQPPYYSKDRMHVVVGGKRKTIQRHSAPPRVHSIREVSAGYTDEDAPFLEKIDAAKISWPRRSRRMKIAAPAFSPVREKPMDVPNITETDDPTGFRRVREELERQFTDLPELPQNLPEDLMGTEAQLEWNQFMSELDRTPPRNIRSPIKPPTIVPGWTTPPHLKKPVKEQEPYQIKLIPGLRDILFQEGPPPEMEYSPPLLKSPCGVCEQPFPSQKSPTLSPEPAGRINTSPYIDQESFPEGFSSPGDAEQSHASDAPLLGRAGDIFNQSPEFLESEMPPEEFMPADTTPPTPSYWDRMATKGSPWTPDITADSFEEHEKQFLEFGESVAPPRRMPPTPKQLEAARLASMKALEQLKLLDAKHEKELIESGESATSPCGVCPAPTRPERDYRTLPSLKQLEAARLATRVSMEQLKQLDGKTSISERKQDVSEKPLLRRVEDIIANIPEPQMPRQKYLPSPEYAQLSPEWSPQLPDLPQYADQIEDEFIPQGVWGYSSPKTPPPSPIRSQKQPQVSPAQAAGSPKQSDSSSTRLYSSPEPNIFDVEAADVDFLEQIAPPEYIVTSPTSPLSPPTPLRVADYYKVHTPPSPGSPSNLAQSVRAHQFTEHYFDKDRRLMSDRIRVKSKVVPVVRSKRPNISPIREDSPRSAPVVSEGKFVHLSPRVVKTETTVKKEIREQSEYPSLDKPVSQAGFVDSAPRNLDFKSPARQRKVQIPPRYDPNIQQIDHNLLERYRLVRRDLFKDQSPHTGIFETSPPGDYSFTSPQRFSPPVGSPSRQYVLSPHSPDQFSGQPQHISFGQRQSPQQPSPRVAYNQNYELPLANYYGSPGRKYVRTPYSKVRTSPGRRVQKTVTVVEEEPYPDFVVSDRIPFAETEYPEIFDTSLIAEDLDTSFVEESMAGFQWMG